MPRLSRPFFSCVFASLLFCFAGLHDSIAQTLPSYLPTDGLAAWWNLNGNSVDASGNGNHGSLVGTVPFANRHGQEGEAIFFNGSGDHILVPLSPSLAISESFSASVWVNLQGGSCNPRVFELHEVLNCGGYTLAFEGSGGGSRGFHTMGFGTCEAGMSAATVGLSVPTNSWHHVGVTFEVAETSVAKLYIDGALASTTSVNRNIGGVGYFGAPLCIGNIAPYRCDWFGGGMDELGFWNRALTDAEVMALYLGEPPVWGCTDSTACNFDLEANAEDGSCLMPGCTDVGACNYDIDAGCDDGSCAPADAVVGCMEPGACNFNAAAVCAGTCVYPAAGLVDCAAGGALCGEGMVWDVAAQTCAIDPEFIAGAIETAVAEALMGCVPVYPGGPGSSGCPGDLSGDGFIGTNDLLELLSLYASMCPEPDPLPGDPCAGLESVNYQGHHYPVVAAGGACWFATNLRVRKYANGDAIPGELSDAAWVAATSGAQAVYAADPERLDTYGRLYNWFAVNDPRGLCPAGWHVPSNVEWMDFEVALGMDPVGVFTTGWRGEDEGAQLKADPSDWVPWNGTDEFGFSAVPGGYRSYMGGGPSFDAGSRGYYWTSSASISGRAWSRGFSTEQSGISRDYSYHQLGFSVRCIKD